RFPLARRESGPGVRRTFGRMWAPIHPNRSRAAVRTVNGVCNDLPGIRIVDLSNADVSRLPAHRISHRVGNALPFMGCENSFVPTFSLEPCRFINGKAGVVADLDTLPVIDIFV